MHCYACPAPFYEVEDTESLVKFFTILGAIFPTGGDTYKTTSLGEAWVNAILSTPPPRQEVVTIFTNIAGEEVFREKFIDIKTKIHEEDNGN